MKQGYNGHRFTSFLLSIAIFIIMLSGFAVTADAEEYSIDGSNKGIFGDVTAELKLNGATFTGGSIKRGDTLHIRVDFNVKEDININAEDKFIYTFPEGVYVTNTQSGDILDSNNIPIGKYSFRTGSGGRTEVVMDFNSDYSASGTRWGYFDADLKFDGDWASDKNDAELDFPGAGTAVTVNFQDSPADFYKYIQGTDTGNGEIIYRIQVRPDAAYSSFIVEDTLGSNLEYVRDSFMLYSGDGTSQKLDITPSGNSFSVDLGGKLKYSTDYNKNLSYIEYRVRVKDPTAENGNNNTAKYRLRSGQESQGSDTTADREYFQKTGSASDKTITWSMHLNNSRIRRNLKNAVLTDELPAGIDVKSVRLRNCDTNEETDILGSLSGGKLNYTFPDKDDYSHYEVIVTAEGEYDQTYNNTASVQWKDSSGGTTTGESNPVKPVKPEQGTQYFVGKRSTNIDSDSGILEWEITLDAEKLSGMRGVWMNDYHSAPTLQWTPTAHCHDIESSFSVVYRPDGGEPKTLVKDKDYSITMLQDTNSWALCDSGFNIYFTGEYDPMPSDMTGTIVISYKSELGEGYSLNPGEFDITNKAQLYDVNGYKGEVSANAQWINEVIVDKRAKNVSLSSDKKSYIFDWDISFNRASPEKDWDYSGISDYGSEPVVIRDIYQTEGMKYVNGSAYRWSGNNEWQKNVNSDIKRIYDSSGNEIGFEYTINNPGSVGYRLHFQTSIPVEMITGSLADLSEDVFHAANYTTAYQGSSELDSSRAVKDVKKGFLDKTAVARGGWQNSAYGVDYIVEINKGCTDLNPSGDYLELTDVIQRGVNLDRNSVQIYSRPYRAEDDSADTLLPEDKYQAAYSSSTRTLRVIVPDEMYIIVKYYVGINAEAGQQVSISNNARLRGARVYNSSTSDMYSVISGTFGGGYSTRSMKVTKADADNISKTLPGAVFLFGEVDVDNSTAENIVLIDGGEQLTTDETGDLPQRNDLVYNRLYCYYEITPPSGYVLDGTKYFFTFPGEGYDAVEANWKAKFGEDFVRNVGTENSHINMVTNKSETPPTPLMEPEETITPRPVVTPAASPSTSPSASPSAKPSVSPSASPSAKPSTSPSASPSAKPSASPSASPSANPSVSPSIRPSTTPGTLPSVSPSAKPSVSPRASPSIRRSCARRRVYVRAQLRVCCRAYAQVQLRVRCRARHRARRRVYVRAQLRVRCRAYRRAHRRVYVRVQLRVRCRAYRRARNRARRRVYVRAQLRVRCRARHRAYRRVYVRAQLRVRCRACHRARRRA